LYTTPTTPLGRAPDPGEIARGSIGPIVTGVETFREIGGFPESVNVATTVEADTAVGIPENEAPVPCDPGRTLSTTPSGSVPDLSFHA
jgi:hypothetical protein